VKQAGRAGKRKPVEEASGRPTKAMSRWAALWRWCRPRGGR
jgi:hypothetical protein